MGLKQVLVSSMNRVGWRRAYYKPAAAGLQISLDRDQGRAGRIMKNLSPVWPLGSLVESVSRYLWMT